MKRIERHVCFGGLQDVYQHESEVLNCTMNFAVYLPPQAKHEKCPVLYWLSGLTCDEQNFITKAGAQQYASLHGIILVVADTSPRGSYIADDDAYDLGQGAGFYINATQAPWSAHYKMYDYIVAELPALIETYFPVTNARSISGHSMGGHGALMIALRNPQRYCSVSAFSPIVAPTQVSWGEKAFSAYLGQERSHWLAYDTIQLLTDSTNVIPMLIDVGTDDPFLIEQLKPELLKAICDEKQHSYILNSRSGYDHNYYFISSFIGEHIAYHAQALKKC